MVRSWTPAVDEPCGGDTVTVRKFSPPASMKAVGSSGASAMAMTKRTVATPSVPHLVRRLRRATTRTGV